MSELRILDETGDTVLKWNLNQPKTVEEAKKKFNEQFKKKGVKAWSADDSGQKTKELKEFDPHAEHIIMTPELVPGPDPASKTSIGAELYF
jgi:hypothetical protein